MRYAMSNWIFADEPLQDQFSRLARFGYEGIELVGEPEKYSRAEVRALCREFHVAVSSVLGWSIWGIPGRDAASPDESERQAALRYGQACADLASELEAPILVVIPAPAGRTAPTGSPQDEEQWLAAYQTEWDLAVDSVRRLADYAARRGVLIALEPINRYETFLVTSFEQAARFLADVGSDQVRLHLDTFHMNLEEPDLPGAVRKAGARLVNMHVSDSNREAPGRGHIDFAGLLRALKEIDYPGYLTLEPVPPGSDPLLMSRMEKHRPLRDVYARESIETLRRLELELESTLFK